jgi:hypothetical protein
MTKRTIRKRTDGPGTSVPLSPVAPTEVNPPELDPPDPAGSHGGRVVRGDASDDDDRQEFEGMEGISLEWKDLPLMHRALGHEVRR